LERLPAAAKQLPGAGFNRIRLDGGVCGGGRCGAVTGRRDVVHPDLVAALSGTDLSLQTVTTKLVAAGKLKIVNVAKEEEVLFRNLNEPADLGEALVPGNGI